MSVASKTTIPVEKDVAQEFSQLAKSQGFSVVRLATDALKLTTELLKRGISPAAIIDIVKLFEKVMAFDAVPVPLSFLELLAEKWGVCDDENVEKTLREMGQKFGTILVEEFRTFGELLQVVSQISLLMPTARLSYVKSGNLWRIVFIPAGERSAKCFVYFAEESIKQFKCRTKIEYLSTHIVAEVMC
ncbi:MAG: hypothetical protein QXP98_07755 [Thermoproteus sp.]